MPQIIVAIDCSGSTPDKDLHGEAKSIQRITAALRQAQRALQDADVNLKRRTSSAGDSLLLVGGVDAVGIYKAAVIHQAIFRAWRYSRIPLKIAIGYGDFETIVSEEDGLTDYRGWDLDFLGRLLEKCPPGRIVLSSPFATLIRDANFGDRLLELHEDFRGLGIRTFYESNGDYVIPQHLRQPAHRRKTDESVRDRRRKNWAMWVIWGIAYAVLLGAILFRGA